MIWATRDDSTLGHVVKLWRKKPELHNGGYQVGRWCDVNDFVEVPSSAYTGPELKDGECKPVLILPMLELKKLFDDLKDTRDEINRMADEVANLRAKNLDLQRLIDKDEMMMRAEQRVRTSREVLLEIKDCVDSLRLRNVIDSEVKNIHQMKIETMEALQNAQRHEDESSVGVRREHAYRLKWKACFGNVYDLALFQKNGKHMDESLIDKVIERYNAAEKYVYGRDIQDDEPEEPETIAEDVPENYPDVEVKPKQKAKVRRITQSMLNFFLFFGDKDYLYRSEMERGMLPSAYDPGTYNYKKAGYVTISNNTVRLTDAGKELKQQCEIYAKNCGFKIQRRGENKILK